MGRGCGVTLFRLGAVVCKTLSASPTSRPSTMQAYGNVTLNAPCLSSSVLVMGNSSWLWR